MNLEEAMSMYAIPIPEDIHDYDKETYREFDNMYLKSFYSTFYSDNDSTTRIRNVETGNNVAVVLGGQIGAGKSSLVADTKRKFMQEGRRIVLVDDDQYRKFYPRGKEILETCPEFYTKITATATGKITPLILKYASDNGYNFIFDGTMKNNRIIETMKTWQGYDIQVRIMAAARLRSLISTAIRNGELRHKQEGRFVTCEIHDETYYGIPESLKFLEQTGLTKDIRIFTRGANPLFPIERFSSLATPEISSADALEMLRKEDEEKFLINAPEDIKYLRSVLPELSEDEQQESERIIHIIEGYINDRGTQDEGETER